jgi:hypothetical protein
MNLLYIFLVFISIYWLSLEKRYSLEISQRIPMKTNEYIRERAREKHPQAPRMLSGLPPGLRTVSPLVIPVESPSVSTLSRLPICSKTPTN